jgi:hypothetical protein
MIIENIAHVFCLLLLLLLLLLCSLCVVRLALYRDGLCCGVATPAELLSEIVADARDRHKSDDTLSTPLAQSYKSVRLWARWDLLSVLGRLNDMLRTTSTFEKYLLADLDLELWARFMITQVDAKAKDDPTIFEKLLERKLQYKEWEQWCR